MAKKTKKTDVTLEELLEAGAHFGHETRRWNPKIARFIYAARDGVHVFDLAKTREALLEACKAAQEAAKEGKVILFVGTKRQARDLVRDAAQKVGMPYVITRWLGGTLTNFEQIGRSIKKLSDMKTSRDAEEYKGYTKRERLLIDREIYNLERLFGGIVKLSELPDMLFVVGAHDEAIAVREAKKLGIPVIGIVDTNTNPDEVDYPIPANDDAVKSISLVVDAITQSVEEGKTKVKKGKSTKGEK